MERAAEQPPEAQKLINEVAELLETSGMTSFELDEFEREVERDRRNKNQKED